MVLHDILMKELRIDMNVWSSGHRMSLARNKYPPWPRFINCTAKHLGIYLAPRHQFVSVLWRPLWLAAQQELPIG